MMPEKSSTAPGLGPDPRGPSAAAPSAPAQVTEPAWLTTLRTVPKVELHVHLVGTLRAETLAEFAGQAQLPLPRPVAELYRYRNFYDFIEVFRIAAQSIRESAQFERALYEYVAREHRDSALAHIELFFNPSYHYPFGVTYRTQLEGLMAGAQAAAHDFGVSVLLIPSIDREFGAGVAQTVLSDVLHHRADCVVGMGLDGPEDRGPPEAFAQVFVDAGRAGLKRTAHVCEDYAPTPADNYRITRELLGCDRFDHGYRILTDPEAVRRARDDGASFTCCPKPSTRERDSLRLSAVRGLLNAGLGVSLATDDPAMFDTDLTDAYRRLMPDPDRSTLIKICENGIDASWAPAERKVQLRQMLAASLHKPEADR